VCVTQLQVWSSKSSVLTDKADFICDDCSANANLELKKKLGSAERILKLGELCRKLETEQEKVLPFCSPEQALGLQPLVDQEEPQQSEAESSAASFDDGDHAVCCFALAFSFCMGIRCALGPSLTHIYWFAAYLPVWHADYCLVTHVHAMPWLSSLKQASLASFWVYNIRSAKLAKHVLTLLCHCAAARAQVRSAFPSCKQACFWYTTA